MVTPQYIFYISCFLNIVQNNNHKILFVLMVLESEYPFESILLLLLVFYSHNASNSIKLEMFEIRFFRSLQNLHLMSVVCFCCVQKEINRDFFFVSQWDILYLFYMSTLASSFQPSQLNKQVSVDKESVTNYVISRKSKLDILHSHYQFLCY